MDRILSAEALATLRDTPMSTEQVIGHFTQGLLATPALRQRVARELHVAAFQKMAVRDADGYRHLWFPIDIDDAADDADRARLMAEAEPELLKALRMALEALAMCPPDRGHPSDCHHNAMSYGRAVIAKAEGRG